MDKTALKSVALPQAREAILKVAEQLGPHELSDQEVLRHIDAWKAGDHEPSLTTLRRVGAYSLGLAISSERR